jgi:putative ABC transport system permease protein
MDTTTYKFWDNQFINLCKGQEQVEEMIQWIMSGVWGFKDFSEKFGKLYDMDFLSSGIRDYLKAWETTTEDFQKLYAYYLYLAGFVPKDAHLALIDKFNDLNEALNDRKKEIFRQARVVGDQKKKISEQKKEIEKQKKNIAEKLQEISNQKKLVTDLKEEIAGQEKLIETQKKEISDHKQTASELKEGLPAE